MSDVGAGECVMASCENIQYVSQRLGVLVKGAGDRGGGGTEKRQSERETAFATKREKKTCVKNGWDGEKAGRPTPAVLACWVEHISARHLVEPPHLRKKKNLLY